MNIYSQNLKKVRQLLGSWQKVAAVCGVSDRAVRKWHEQGRPPRTEYTGETHYALIIDSATNGKVHAHELLPDISIARL
ncbi:MAG: YdaS family helix-turn-helix protein [Methylococcaceae bacterium]|jgi:DNA-binding transcriptional regulator YdaS (Cro superfamily)